jgi:uncharacterized LabA/DUF88 family protein
MDRLFFFTNDRDYIPLCKTLKDFGVNVSLIHLSEFTRPNRILTQECDSYDLFPAIYLDEIFEKNPQARQKELDIIKMEDKSNNISKDEVVVGG